MKKTNSNFFRNALIALSIILVSLGVFCDVAHNALLSVEEKLEPLPTRLDSIKSNLSAINKSFDAIDSMMKIKSHVTDSIAKAEANDSLITTAKSYKGYVGFPGEGGYYETEMGNCRGIVPIDRVGHFMWDHAEWFDAKGNSVPEPF